jgi:hypothetical protein
MLTTFPSYCALQCVTGVRRAIALLCMHRWCAVFPPPPMARLQPMPASHELLAPFDAAIYALRPNWAHPEPEMRAEVQRLGWRILADNGSVSQAGIWQKLEAVMQSCGGVVDPACSELSRGIFDELPPWKVRVSARCLL